MDLLNAISFSVVAALLVMSPGPNGVLIAKTVPSFGKVAGFANIAGFVTGFYMHGTLSILGISAILLASSTVFLLVKLIGATYLCWIGYKALRDAISGKTTTQNVELANNAKSADVLFNEGFLTGRDAYTGKACLQSSKPANNTRSIRAAYIEGFLTNALNPKTSMFYLAAPLSTSFGLERW